MLNTHRLKTHGVKVGRVQVGGGAPIVIQSITNTDTADVAGTARQCLELATAGSEMVRITVNVPEAAAAVPEIKPACSTPARGAADRRFPLQRTRAARQVPARRCRAR